MKRLKVERADFDKLIARLRKRGISWTTWQMEGKKIVYTGREHKRIIRDEIKALQEGGNGKEHTGNPGHRRGKED